MKTMIMLIIVAVLAGCGGGGGSEGDNSTGAAQAPQTQSLTCSHGGDLWLCNEQNSCVRDESTEVVEVSEEEKRLVVKAKLASGNITIIAECGSSVVFDNREETNNETDANTVNVSAEVSPQVGLNQ